MTFVPVLGDLGDRRVESPVLIIGKGDDDRNVDSRNHRPGRAVCVRGMCTTSSSSCPTTPRNADPQAWLYTFARMQTFLQRFLVGQEQERVATPELRRQCIAPRGRGALVGAALAIAAAVRRGATCGPRSGSGTGSTPSSYLTREQLTELDATSSNDEDWESGVSLSIVQGDSAIYTKGSAFAHWEAGARRCPDVVCDWLEHQVDDRRTHCISSTKADAVGRSVWKYYELPRCRSYAVTRRPCRDLLSHRTDVENNLSAWYRSTLTRAQLVERLRFLSKTQASKAGFSTTTSW